MLHFLKTRWKRRYDEAAVAQAKYTVRALPHLPQLAAAGAELAAHLKPGARQLSHERLAHAAVHTVRAHQQLALHLFTAAVVVDRRAIPCCISWHCVHNQRLACSHGNIHTCDARAVLDLQGRACMFVQDTHRL